MENKWSLLRLVLFAAWLISSLACGLMNRTDGNSSNRSVANSKTDENSNQKSEQVAAPKGLKPPEPCAWFEKSLDLKAKEYKPSSSMPDLSYCVQVKPLANNGSFEYHAIGDAEIIKKFFVYVRVNERHSAKQKEDSYKMLSLTAMEIADRAGGQKLTDEILTAIGSGASADFILPPGEDKSRPQIKTVYVENKNRGEGWSVRTVTLGF